MGCEMHRWWGMRSSQFDACGVRRQEIQAFPHVQRWYGQLQHRPAARGVLDLALS
jgi:glutathione S-transferase